MFGQIAGITLIASCLGSADYFGGTKATLTRDEDAYTYRLVYESFKGPDGDGEAKVIADVSESILNATHMEDSMLYEFNGWEFEIFKPFTAPDKDNLSAMIRKFDASGQAKVLESLTCSFHD